MNLKKEHSENNEYKAEINAMKRNWLREKICKT